MELSISAQEGLWSSVSVRVRVCGSQYHKYLRRDSLRSSKSLFNKCGFPSRRKNLLVGLTPVSCSSSQGVTIRINRYSTIDEWTVSGVFLGLSTNVSKVKKLLINFQI